MEDFRSFTNSLSIDNTRELPNMSNNNVFIMICLCLMMVPSHGLVLPMASDETMGPEVQNDYDCDEDYKLQAPDVSAPRYSAPRSAPQAVVPVNEYKTVAAYQPMGVYSGGSVSFSGQEKVMGAPSSQSSFNTLVAKNNDEAKDLDEDSVPQAQSTDASSSTLASKAPKAKKVKTNDSSSIWVYMIIVAVVVGFIVVVFCAKQGKKADDQYAVKSIYSGSGIATNTGNHSFDDDAIYSPRRQTASTVSFVSEFSNSGATDFQSYASGSTSTSDYFSSGDVYSVNPSPSSSYTSNASEYEFNSGYSDSTDTSIYISEASGYTDNSMYSSTYHSSAIPEGSEFEGGEYDDHC